MQKNKNGITLVALIFMIIIIIILSSIFIATSLRALKETRNSEIQSEKHALEEAILNRYVSYMKNDKSSNVDLVGSNPSSKWSSPEECAAEALKYVDLTDFTEEEDRTKKVNKITSDIVSDYDEYVKIITASDAKRLGVEAFQEDSVYIVDYRTSTVYGPIEQ